MKPITFSKTHGKWFANEVLRAIRRYQMIAEGETICVGLSGGKDSITLLYILRYLQQFSKLNFSLHALHIKTFEDYDTSVLGNYCRQLDVPYHEATFEIDEEPPRKSVCYTCSRLKKGSMSQFLAKHNIQKIAYGHHADDVAETFLMNLIQNRKVGSFSPRVEVPGNSMVTIRPMVYLEESLITKLHNHFDLPLLDYNCPYGHCNIRSGYKELVQAMQEKLEINDLAGRMSAAMENVDETNLWKNLWAKE